MILILSRPFCNSIHITHHLINTNTRAQNLRDDRKREREHGEEEERARAEAENIYVYGKKKSHHTSSKQKNPLRTPHTLSASNVIRRERYRENDKRRGKKKKKSAELFEPLANRVSSSYPCRWHRAEAAQATSFSGDFWNRGSCARLVARGCARVEQWD